MYIKHLCFAVFCWLSAQTAVFGQNFPIGTRSAAMTNSSVMLSDLWSVYHNQAGLGHIEDVTFGTHFENAYFSEKLSMKAAALALPTRPGTFGISFSYLGYSLYNQIKAGLAYSRSFGEKISVGIQLSYYNINQSSLYGNRGTPAAELGLRFEPVESLQVGVHVSNPTKADIADYTEAVIPTVLRFGVGYTFGDRLLITAEAEKDMDFDVVIKTGIEYQLLESIYLRGGYTTMNDIYAFGAGFKFGSFKTDLAFSKHPILDFTPHISMSYAF